MKTCFALFYAELFKLASKQRKLVFYIATSAWVLAYFCLILVIFLACLPLSNNWNPKTTSANCPTYIKSQTFATICAINIATDVDLLVLPLFVIFSLRLKKAERVSLILVFGIGTISMVSSIVRFVVLFRRFQEGLLDAQTIHLYSILSHTEVTFGLLAFTLPALRYTMLDIVKRFEFWAESATQRQAPVTIGGSGSARKNVTASELSRSLFTEDVRPTESLIELTQTSSQQEGSLCEVTSHRDTREH